MIQQVIVTDIIEAPQAYFAADKILLLNLHLTSAN